LWCGVHGSERRGALGVGCWVLGVRSIIYVGHGECVMESSPTVYGVLD